MEIDLTAISGLGDYTEHSEKSRIIYRKNNQAFLVVNKNTIEVRTDTKLANLLKDKYESVMTSRYFGKGGIEIVLTDQLTKTEIDDLIRLSYNLTEN